MTKWRTRSIKLTGRITESKSSIEDIEFVEKKLRQGMSQAVLIRQAVSLYRRYEEGELYSKKAEESFSQSISTTSNFKEQNEEMESRDEVKKERNIDQRQAEKLKNSLDMKLKSNSFL